MMASLSVAVHIVEASAQCLSGNISVLENVLDVCLERLSGFLEKISVLNICVLQS